MYNFSANKKNKKNKTKNRYPKILNAVKKENLLGNVDTCLQINKNPSNTITT